jgi:hypothetical protein
MRTVACVLATFLTSSKTSWIALLLPMMLFRLNSIGLSGHPLHLRDWVDTSSGDKSQWNKVF